jgi:hypothetical protein
LLVAAHITKIINHKQTIYSLLLILIIHKNQLLLELNWHETRSRWKWRELFFIEKRPFSPALLKA